MASQVNLEKSIMRVMKKYDSEDGSREKEGGIVHLIKY